MQIKKRILNAFPASLALRTLTGVMLLTTTGAYAEGIDGNVGVLRVKGALTESACRLDMTSAWQEVSLGELGTGRLQSLGASGPPVAVKFKLQDCLRASSHNLDERTGTLAWSALQPSVVLSVVAPVDVDNPQLVRVSGAGGVGLRLRDAAHRPVFLGQRATPLLLTPGQNELVYTVALERTRAALMAGAYWAQINFKLNYD